MASRFFLICLIALMVVGMTTAFPYELDDDQDAEALMFLKRDPLTQNLLLAEKRGANMKKFKGKSLGSYLISTIYILIRIIIILHLLV